MEFTEKILRKEVRDLKRLKDTFDDRFEYLRLDKNERLLPFQEELLDEFRKKIKSEDISGYGEIGPLCRKLAGHLGVAEGQILLAAGSDLAIKSVYEACVERGDNVVLHAPCYAMYKVYARMFGAEAVAIPVKDDWNADIEKMLDSVNEKTKFMALENPNGFVGSGISTDDIARTAAELKDKDIILIVDEAYYYIENKGSDAIKLIREFPNLIISQTFSKAHGLAGMRAGYLIGDARLIEPISRVRPMHEITSLTALAMEWVLDHPEMLEEYRASVRESRAFLRNELRRLAVDHRDTRANFMLLYLPDEGRTKGITKKLRERRILIRRPFEEDYLKGYSRVCIGTLQDSKVFISALETVLKTPQAERV